ncbi:hypothetical protein CEXT_327521 [Caerostris extrusa]|uniref:Uncharacterized protein n=1 Tax=Caerostris extrusa TaxID=172846 RepID=A0AAV4SJW2_CAEEX|nr:hypothetical protein CEXT_327521 [Caerostris extrusa]
MQFYAIYTKSVNLALLVFRSQSSFVFVVFCAVAYASHHGHHEHHHHHPQPYKFGYDIKDHHGSQHRHEHGDGHGNVHGSYGFADHRGVTEKSITWLTTMDSELK